MEEKILGIIPNIRKKKLLGVRDTYTLVIMITAARLGWYSVAFKGIPSF